MPPRKEVTLSLLAFIILVILATGLAASYRFPSLELRPMHTDEAILGMKLGEYWNTGHFEYDPKDFHGPALHQTSILWGSLAGWDAPETWTEANLRVVAALCGLGLLLTTLLFVDALGKYGSALAMLLTAVSPMMVFYSRYFIMEMQLVLLISLTLGCFWRYSQGGTRLWLVLGGCALGFQHATKETFILNVGAAVVGWVVARSLIGDFEPRRGNSFKVGPSRTLGRAARPWLWVLIPAAVISVASFSNGFRDWGAVADSFLTYLNYLERSGGSGHEKPWHYYLTLLVWRKDTLVWTEALIVGLALVGMAFSLLGDFQKNPGRQAFLVFLSVYTLVLLAGYSVLSYKTPWSILSAQHALTLLAGAGAHALWAHVMPGKVMRWGFNLLLTAGIWHLCDQSIRLTGTHSNPQFDYSADARNPYVYSHTQKSLLKMIKEVNDYVGDKAEEMKIQVITPDSGWPMPWYWRTWKNVGYQETVPASLDADVIVADAEFYDLVKAKLPPDAYTENYPYGLRPGIILTLFLKKPEVEPPAPAPPSAQEEEARFQGPPPPPPEGTLSAPPIFSPALPALPGSTLVPIPQP
ncbi:phospholipid carrier-dependent glycosyltransferase [Prosthecobacter sp. SYSU 5D2]|uniref:phospholipid carrier-dependent glycosyltransferase n=1 Tax=Prosthecobacter sp. SYSU 5D2 TaxID=3134134 RepID=UPI0031FE8220